MDRRKFLTLMGTAPIAAGAAVAGIPAASAITTLGGVNLGGMALGTDGWDLIASDSNLSFGNWTTTMRWDIEDSNPIVSGMDDIEGAMDSLTRMVDNVAKNTVKNLDYGVRKVEHLSQLPIKPWVKMANSYADRIVKTVDDTQELWEDTIEAIEDHHGGDDGSGSDQAFDLPDFKDHPRFVGDSSEGEA